MVDALNNQKPAFNANAYFTSTSAPESKTKQDYDALHAAREKMKGLGAPGQSKVAGEFNKDSFGDPARKDLWQKVKAFSADSPVSKGMVLSNLKVDKKAADDELALAKKNGVEGPAFADLSTKADAANSKLNAFKNEVEGKNFSMAARNAHKFGSPKVMERRIDKMDMSDDTNRTELQGQAAQLTKAMERIDHRISTLGQAGEILGSEGADATKGEIANLSRQRDAYKNIVGQINDRLNPQLPYSP